MAEITSHIESLNTQVSKLISALNLEQKKQRLLEMEEQMQAQGFWESSESGKFAKTAASLKSGIELWEGLQRELEDLHAMVSESEVGEKGNQAALYADELERLRNIYLEHRLEAMFSGKYDDHDALCSLHAGAGGTDAQDFCEMLLRMYERFADRKGFSLEILDISKGGEAGIKSVVFGVHGENAYGCMRAEAGVHRLVRQSPFNQKGTRETSFALLEAIPELLDAESSVLDPKDVEIEVTTSSGHGGQSVNTTYSAVRMTHVPTGIKVSIQNERSQRQNREIAMKILASKVTAFNQAKVEEERKALRGEYKSAEWGNQIRSYVLHPYKMVKDHRTGHETSDPQRVLDGDLEDFIEAYLETTLT